MRIGERQSLNHYLTGITTETTKPWFFAIPTDPEAFPIAVSLLMMSAAGQFLRDDVPRISQDNRRNGEATAFESLAFVAYAVRWSYERLTSRMSNSISDAFDMALKLCCAMAERESGLSLGRLWHERMKTYGSCSHLGGRNGATQHFHLILSCIGHALEPQDEYGPPHLGDDVFDAFESMAVVHVFASAIQAGVAEAIRNTVRHYQIGD